MSLQNISILTQPQPWQESAGVQHTLSLDQTLKDNKADASARQPAQKPTASACRYRFPCRALGKGQGLRELPVLLTFWCPGRLEVAAGWFAGGGFLQGETLYLTALRAQAGDPKGLAAAQTITCRNKMTPSTQQQISNDRQITGSWKKNNGVLAFKRQNVRVGKVK